MVDLTYIIPTFALCESRITNLQKILNDIIPHECDIIVAEQYLEAPVLEHLISQYNHPRIRHLKFKMHYKSIHKCKLINISTRFCNTTHFFLHDVDFSVNYKNLYDYYNNDITLHDYIQPYEITRDLTEAETQLYKTDKNFVVDYFPPDFKQKQIRHVNVYGALGFIINKKKFIKLGGMDERYTGWGFEDFDLFMRLHQPLPDTPLIQIPRGVNGVHMWHPPSDLSNLPSNQHIFKNKNFTIGKLNTLLKKYYYTDWVYDVLEPV